MNHATQERDCRGLTVHLHEAAAGYTVTSKTLDFFYPLAVKQTILSRANLVLWLHFRDAGIH